jgi:acyl carrier protein
MSPEFIEILTSVNAEIFDDPNADLVEEDIIDSLDVMNIVVLLEEAYGIDFDPDDVSPENFASAETIWNVLQKSIAEGQG